MAPAPPPPPLDNAAIAELLALRAEKAKGDWGKALRKASRAALTWPEEAAAIEASGRRIEDELWRIGPKTGALVREWLASPPEVPEPPPIRRDFLTLARARAVLDAADPAWRRDFRGDHQMHTTWSDGTVSIEEMARAAAALGHRRIVITDHSKELKIAGGMDEATLERQLDEIAAVNGRLAAEGLALRVLAGIEMNLHPDGSGDMDPAVLARLDLVLGSFHSKLRLAEDQTARYLAALANPDIHVLGHPRGRIYNFRLGLAADWPAVFAEAARRGKAVEIDGYPDRQDLDRDLLRLARDAGCEVSIGTDAHGPDELALFELGIAAAVEAGIPRERILNYRDPPRASSQTRR
ncbi:MAG TPA: PHP domain-containing protein [Planctomycetota bacterium]|nr:PHP domain-containing protein [Planctomycetota bacterium]